MRIVLDECVTSPLAKHLTNHTCTSPQRRGWGGLENGDLLRLAEEEYDLFVTSDQNLRYQQNLVDRKIAILELSTNGLGDYSEELGCSCCAHKCHATGRVRPARRRSSRH